MKIVLLLVCFMVFMLSGCDAVSDMINSQTTISKLREENTVLSKRNEYLENVLSASEKNRQEKENAAALAAACDYGLQVCPSDIVEQGHKAMTEGFLPDKTLFSWIWAKISSMILVSYIVMVSCYFLFRFFWSRETIKKLHSAESDLKTALRAKDDAIEEQARITWQKKYEVEQLEARREAIESAIQDAQLGLADILTRTEEAESRLSQAEAASKALTAAFRR